ncbi:MAG TPA: hypothetical protein EYQ50_26430 [Verrucomicrobiales bacterium]|nr:hypothetical protein [Verrucomicrobiales bacterium]HIL70824.1 hypothetical protein [Verrucomicrobiota bacterium]
MTTAAAIDSVETKPAEDSPLSGITEALLSDRIISRDQAKHAERIRSKLDTPLTLLEVMKDLKMVKKKRYVRPFAVTGEI